MGTVQSMVVNGVVYSIDQVVQEPTLGKSNFEKSTFAFCRDWLAGKKEFIMPTSGSTGIPKSIVVQRNQMIASAEATGVFLGLKAGDNALVCLDTKYIAGAMMLVRCFHIGMNPIIVEPSSNPIKSVESTIDFAAFVPLQLRYLLDESSTKLNQISTAIIGGASIDLQLENEVKKLTVSLYSTYGMTETISHVALKRLNGDQIDTAYRALPGIVFETDSRGCLIANVPYLSEPIITNDLVELVSKTSFHWIGRWDNIINSGGIKISPEKLETELQFIFQKARVSNRFFAGARQDKLLGQKVCLIIEGPQLPPPQISYLESLFRDALERYSIPKEIIFVEKFVETASGKINREATLNLSPV